MERTPEGEFGAILICWKVGIQAPSMVGGSDMRDGSMQDPHGRDPVGKGAYRAPDTMGRKEWGSEGRKCGHKMLQVR